MKCSHVFNLLWIAGVTITVCSELYEAAAWPSLVISSALTTYDLHRIYKRAAKSPATSNQKGFTNTPPAPSKEVNKPATAASKKNIPGGPAKPKNDNGKGAQPARSVGGPQNARSGSVGVQLTGSGTANDRLEKNSPKSTLKHSNGFAMALNQKAKKNGMDTDSKSSSSPRKLPFSRHVSPRLKTDSRGTLMSKDKQSKIPKAGFVTSGKGRSTKSVNTGMKSNTRSTRASKLSVDNEEDGQLCKRAKTGGCKKKTSRRKTLVNIPEMMKSSSSIELGKLRSFWQNHPGVFPPACISTAGTIITACANIANAHHDPQATTVAQAVGSSMTAGALVYGLVAGYHGHAAKENLSKEDLKKLGDGLTSKAIQAPVDAYKKGSECVGKACKAIGLDKVGPCIGNACKAVGLDKVATCIGEACERIGLKKPKPKQEENREGTTTTTRPDPPTSERVESAPAPETNPRRSRVHFSNLPWNDDIQVTQSGNLRVPPYKPTTLTTTTSAAASSRLLQGKKSEIEPDEQSEAEAGRLKRTMSARS